MSRGQGLIAVVIGASMLLAVAVMAFSCLRVLRFLPVQGIVRSTAIDSVVAGRINLHKPVIEYSYTVDGVAYKNDVFDPLDDNATEEWANGIVRRYQVGAACTVYYDPSSPEKSVLCRRPNDKAIWIMAGFVFLGALFLASGMIGVCRQCGGRDDCPS